jgi:2,3,4,5-tetrahydropyridine-2-carboxylate N-succinyltransferase
MTLQTEVESLWEQYTADEIDAQSTTASEMETLDAFLDALEAGEVRAAEKTGSGVESWEANAWVKRGILLNFGLRETHPREYGDVTYHDVLPLRETDDLADKGTRNTPDGTVIRRGAFLGEDCIMMSPSFVNVGASVGDGTLVDSCDTVGSCAQIGEDVKLGANTLIGGVSLGAGCRVTSGFRVGENTIVGENTLLTPRIPVYDLVEEEVIYGRLPSERRAFTRMVESSIGDHDLFAGSAYKPAVVALDIEDDTRDATRREEALRE